MISLPNVKSNTVHRFNVHTRISYLIKYRALYFMVLPVILFFAIFSYWPMYGVTIAFKELNIVRGITASPWVGFQYFQEVFQNEGFWLSFRNTLIISTYKIILVFPAPIILALLMNEILSNRFKRTIQTILYLPRFISWVIVSGLLINFLSINGGIVNNLIELAGVEPVNFLIDENLIRGLVVATSIWKEAGWGTIIYMAAISSVNIELYEVARIDGANRWQRMWYVTIASIKSIITIMLILSVGNIMNANFEQIIVMYSPLVYEKIDIIDTYVYRMGVLNGRYSFSAAIGLFKSVIAFIFIFCADRFVKWAGEEGLF